jgi:hypothetical protein
MIDQQRGWTAGPWGACLAGVLLLPVLTPIFVPDRFPTDPPLSDTVRWIGWLVAAAIPCLTFAAIWRGPLSARGAERAPLLVLLFLLAALQVDLHHTSVDVGNYFHGLPYDLNVDWQRDLHRDILHGNPEAVPHPYRFLPNCLVAWLSQVTGNYLVSALVYRLTVQFLLLVATYEYARVWSGHAAAVVAVLLVSAAYPISIRFYAGQLVDPLSHLSFVVGLLCLEWGWGWPLLATVLIGSLAKESVLVLPVLGLLVYGRERELRLPLGLSLGLGLLLAAGIRVAIAGDPAYEKISHVTPDHVFRNLWHLSYLEWPRQTWHTAGWLLPLVVWGWRAAAPRLRGTILVLLPALLASNVVFSSLKESRNLMPVVVPMAVIAAGVLLGTGQPPVESPSRDAARAR